MFGFKKEGKKSKKNKKNKEIQIEEIQDIETEDNVSALGRGILSEKDLFAPPSFDRSNPEYMKVGSKYVKSFTLQGYPASVRVGWLDNLYSYGDDMDTAIYVEPADEREALDELTKKITQFEAQLATEEEKGNRRNITRLGNKIAQLYREREGLELNYENLFYVQIMSNLYANSEDDLIKKSQLIDNKLKGRRIKLQPAYLNQDDSYKSVLPFGKIYTKDQFRNFNSGALTACFPFYNSEISHDEGVFTGVNLSTMTPVFIDFYNRRVLDNSNFTVFGSSGSGKTYFVSLLTLRSTLKGVRTTIIDPEGEYERLTKAVGGSHVYIAADSETKINPFDIEEEDETDDEGNPTGKKILTIKDKVADNLNLIAVMAGGLTREQESLVSTCIDEMYRDKGFTDDVDSLYNNEAILDAETGEFIHDGIKKDMPTFSDFHNKLEKLAEKENSEDLRRLAVSLRMFKKGGVYDMFDCQTSNDIDFKNSPVITFDISKLEESVLRPIGMYIALTWTWEKFIKKNPRIQKRVVCDEAWMLVNKNMAGHEYTSAFLDKASRRIRKRNGGLLVASQNFVEFENNEQGKAVLTNSSLNVFMKQNSTDIDALQDTFKLSDGERNFLSTSKRGEMLIRSTSESSVAFAMSFPHEHYLITGEK